LATLNGRWQTTKEPLITLDALSHIAMSTSNSVVRTAFSF